MPALTLVCLIAGTVLAVVVIALNAVVGSKYAPLVSGLPDKDHFFKGIYPLGFFALDAIHFSFDRGVAAKRMRDSKAIHGKVYAEYYARLNYAQKISVCLLLLPLVFLLYPIFSSSVAFLLGIVAVVCAWWYFDMQITDEMEKRDDEIARDLPDVLSKLTLLVNAGMIFREAWKRVSATGSSTIYLEMRNAAQEMDNGANEAQALMAFGERCGSPEVKKFSSTLVQSVSKGNRELVDYLRKQSSMSWEEKKQYVRTKGEEASSKLMLPVAGMMIGILIMVAVPMLGNVNI